MVRPPSLHPRILELNKLSASDWMAWTCCCLNHHPVLSAIDWFMMRTLAVVRGLFMMTGLAVETVHGWPHSWATVFFFLRVSINCFSSHHIVRLLSTRRHRGHHALAFLLFWVYCTFYTSSADSRWHECGHGTAFKTKWMNDVMCVSPHQVSLSVVPICFGMSRFPTES